MAKQLVDPRKAPRFTSLSGASGPVTINQALLDNFLPSKEPVPRRGCLLRGPSAIPLSKDKIRLDLSKSSPSSASCPQVIPYSVWKKVNLTNPTIILDLLSPLGAFGYHTPLVKTANGVVLDKPGKAS